MIFKNLHFVYEFTRSSITNHFVFNRFCPAQLTSDGFMLRMISQDLELAQKQIAEEPCCLAGEINQPLLF